MKYKYEKINKLANRIQTSFLIRNSFLSSNDFLKVNYIFLEF